ncbi:hypothetical protein AX14_006127 [Amanita brunnescens Koide BX004]|nr:hypothetical protein AX14_006127 [Amanita brunnescens Koide BX004]
MPILHLPVIVSQPESDDEEGKRKRRRNSPHPGSKTSRLPSLTTPSSRSTSLLSLPTKQSGYAQDAQDAQVESELASCLSSAQGKDWEEGGLEGQLSLLRTLASDVNENKAGLHQRLQLENGRPLVSAATSASAKPGRILRSPKRNIIELASFDPRMQKENWVTKGKFPPTLKPSSASSPSLPSVSLRPFLQPHADSVPV